MSTYDRPCEKVLYFKEQYLQKAKCHQKRRFHEIKAFLHFSFICTCLICLLIFAPLCFHDGNTIIVSSAAILELCVLSIQKVNIK